MESARQISLATWPSVTVGALSEVRARLGGGNTGVGPMAFSDKPNIQVDGSSSRAADRTL
jgi:hypothetical protein